MELYFKLKFIEDFIIPLIIISGLIIFTAIICTIDKFKERKRIKKKTKQS